MSSKNESVGEWRVIRPVSASVCFLWLAGILAGCSGGGGKKDESEKPGSGVLTEGAVEAGGPTSAVAVGSSPGTGAISGAVKADGVRGADLGGVEGAVRGGGRGIDLGGAEQGVRGGVRGAVRRHPVAEGQQDKCAVFKKYSDQQCNIDCVEFDPDCKLPPPPDLSFDLSFIDKHYVNYLNQLTPAMGDQSFEAFIRVYSSSAPLVGLSIGPTSSAAISSGPLTLMSLYSNSGPGVLLMREFARRIYSCESAHLSQHVQNNYCEDWTIQEYPSAGKYVEATVGYNDYKKEVSGDEGSRKKQVLEGVTNLIAGCFQFKDDSDCSKSGPDVCIAEKKYSNGTCDTDCAQVDSDCAVTQASGLVTIAAAEVCVEGTGFCTYSDENGNFQLSGVPPGEQLLIIRKQGKSGQGYAISQSITVVGDNIVAVGDKALQETGAISGKVIRAEAKNHLGTDVFVPGTSFTAKTDEQGNFILLNMPVGKYRLAAMFPGFEANKWENIDVKSKSDTKLAAVTLAHAPAEVKPRSVSGQVISTDGIGVGNVIISSVPESDKVTTDPNGNFVLKGLQPITYSIRGDRGGYGSSSRTLDLTFTETANITVILTNFQGRTNNTPPTIQITGVATAQPGESVKLTALVADPDADDLIFVRWGVNGGALSSTSGTEVNWTAPSQQGVFVIQAQATDGQQAGFTFHLITSAKGGSIVRIDTSRPSQPKANLLTVNMNAPGKSDTIFGAAGAVEAGASVKIYADGLLQTKIAEGTVKADGAFDAIDLGDNKGDANDLLYLVVFDSFGNMSDRFFFLNDKRPPDVTIIKQPCGVGTITCYAKTGTATFEFIVSEPGSSVACNLDSAGYTACSSPLTYQGLSDGTHLLLVLATDTAQNPDSSPAAYAWAVDATAPAAGTVSPTNTATSTHVDSPFDLSTTFSDAGSGVLNCEYCKSTDGACDSEWTAASFSASSCSVTALTCTEGQSVTLSMRATDAAGNVGTGTAVSRTCDTTAPAAVSVKDGTGNDYDVQTKSANIAANWTAATDATSGLDRYEFAVGTSACTGAAPSNIMAYANNGTSVSASAGSLSLTGGTTYYVNVKSFDKVGNSRCDSSDGVQIVPAIADSGTVSAVQVSLALDSNGRPHVCDQESSSLRYAKNVSGTWDVATVDSGGDIPGSHCSIVLDSNGKAHIAYYQVYTTAQNLRYATNKTGSWVLTTVDDTVANTGLYTSIATDSSGNPHISYQDATNDDLKYAKFVGSGGSGCTSVAWTCETADAAGGTYTSLLIDSSGKAHISYYAVSTAKYATNASGSWVLSTVFSGIGSGFTSIGRDSNGKFHVAFYNANSGDLGYATNASGSWVNETVDSVGTIGNYCSLAVDSNNKIHISYYDSDNGDLKYANGTAGNFTKSTVESAGNVGQYSSLKLDSGNNPFIAHFDTTNSDSRLFSVNP